MSGFFEVTTDPRFVDNSGEPVRDAATIVIVRQTQTPSLNEFEVLLLERSGSLSFAAGMYAFPGGAVEQKDLDPLLPHLAGCRAAVRECFEETGLTISVEAALPLARWLTPPGMKRRYDARFYVAEIDLSQDVRVDGSEIVSYMWVTPRDAVRLVEDNKIKMLPPTIGTLKTLEALKNWQEIQDYVHTVGEPPIANLPT